MKPPFYISLFLIISSISSYGQTITILDNTTHQPVFNVTIHSKSNQKFTVSDENGQADISGLTDTITLQHPSYETLNITRDRMEEWKFNIKLEPKIIGMKEVVISANKWEQKPAEIPHKIIAIPVSTINFNNPQTSADILERSGKVFVQKSQLGGGSPMIRGFGANAVLIVVDGIRMNNPIFRSGNLQNIINIDPNMLEGAEVIEGPGSVIYGSDALGGVMDFHTREINLGKIKRISGSSFIRFSSANKEKTWHVNSTLAHKNFGWFGGFTYSTFSHLRAGANRPKHYPEFGKRNYYVERIDNEDQIIENQHPDIQIHSAYKQFNTVQKLKWKWHPKITTEYLFNLSTTSDIPRYDRLILEKNGIPVNAEWYYGPQFWMMNALKFRVQETNYWDELKISLGVQSFKESRNDRKFQNPTHRFRTEKVNVYSLNLDAYKTFEFIELYYGAEANHSRVSSSAYSQNIMNGSYSPTRTRYPDGGSDVNSFAVYFSSKKNLALQKLFLNTGIRYNYQQMHAKILDESFPFNEIDNTNNALVGNLGLTWLPNSQFNWSILASSGFRAPNLDDQAKVFDSEPGNVIVPNPNLQPEYSYNLESSIHWNPLNNLTLDVTGFHSWMRDAMVRSDFQFNGNDSIDYDGVKSNIQALTNAGKAVIFGINAGINYQFSDQWRVSSYINWTDGYDLQTKETLRHITPIFGMTSLVFHRDKLKLEFYTRYNGTVAFDQLPPSEQNKLHLYTDEGALSWFTLNLRSEYQFNNYFSLNAAVENLLNTHYRTYSSGISAPGINAIVALKVHF